MADDRQDILQIAIIGEGEVFEIDFTFDADAALNLSGKGKQGERRMVEVDDPRRRHGREMSFQNRPFRNESCDRVHVDHSFSARAFGSSVHSHHHSHDDKVWRNDPLYPLSYGSIDRAGQRKNGGPGGIRTRDLEVNSL